jgi:hypothetical protein
MKNLKLLELPDLLDLLIEQTAHYTRLISVGTTPEELRISREILKELQSEIKLRKSTTDLPQNITPSQEGSSIDFFN